MGNGNGDSVLTVLVENCATRRGLLGEHGLAIWIEAGGKRILFDTGQGVALRHNAEALGVDLAATDAVVLSHGHYDHANGLAAVGDRLSRALLFVHPAAFRPRFAGSGAHDAREVGSGLSGWVRARSLVGGIVHTPNWTQVSDGVWATGEIPRHTDFEDTGEPFFLDDGLAQPDPLTDDQALVIETPHGLSVLLGCAHAGVVNTLDHVAERTGERRFHLVLGGMHLRSASAERVDRTVDALRRYQVQRVGPAHCTGQAATARLRAEWKSGFIEVHPGCRLRI